MRTLLGAILFVINAILGFVVIIVFLRFVFLFFGASAAAPFVGWLYDVSYPFVFPFVGIFPNFRLGGLFFESASLVAMLIYVLAAYLFNSLFAYLSREPLSQDDL